MRFHCVLSVCAALTATAALADITYTETFDNGNPAGWTYGSANSFIDNGFGNPAPALHDDFLDTFAPQPGTGWGVDSIFTGDYRSLGVSSIGVDLYTMDVDFSAEGRKLTVMLISDNGTPNNFDDDWAAYDIGQRNIPVPGQSWRSYDFEIPSDSATLPAGWKTISLGFQSPQNPDWNDVITDVDQLRFFYGDPELFFIFQVWDVALDNPRITYIPEPATLGLLAAGAAVALRRRRA